MPISNLLGILSGALIVGGYILYIKMSLRKEIEPNPTTWLMFTYGTSLLTILEWDRGATIWVLLNPIVCASASIVVACICWRKGTIKFPDNKVDRVALVSDLTLTALYLFSWTILFLGVIGEEVRAICALIFLIGSNAINVTSFTPILRGTYQEPSSENWQPWVIWTLSYVAMLLATHIDITRGDGSYDLLLYPASCIFLHGAVAVFSLRRKVSIKRI